MCWNGAIGCRLKNGSMDSIILDTHRSIHINDALARGAPQRR